MSDQEFAKVAEVGSEDDFMELPVESDGNILLSTVQAQFPSAIGLKYKSESGGWRGIRAAENVLNPPSGGWGDRVFFIAESNSLKRKSTDANDEKKPAKFVKKKSYLEDIIVLGLPYTTSEDELKDYFTKSCGELAYHEIKYDRKSNESRGFGFIRFMREDDAKKAINDDHFLQGRKLEVRLSKKKDNPIKLFVGRLPNGTSKEDLEEYFGEYGEMIDIFVPTPFRGFGFITFAEEKDGLQVLRMSHVMGGTRLNVTAAEPKEGKGSKRQENFGVTNYSWNPSKSRDSNRYQEPPPQKDVASELKDMLMTLISQQK